jgi:hypothetical protein
MSGTAGLITFYRGEDPLRADKLNAAFVERLLRAGDSMTGSLLLSQDPVVPFEAATKQYVDGRFSLAQVSTIPPNPAQGKLWFDSNSGQLFIWYDDVSSAQWVLANNIGAAGSGGGGFLPLTGGTIGTPGWLEAIIGETETNSDFVSLANRGGSAGVFGTKTSNAPSGSAGALGAWAIGGFGINDNTVDVQTAYGQYLEVRRNAGAGVVQGAEIAVVNHGDVKRGQPWYIAETGSTIGLWLSAGREDAPPNNDISVALGIISQGAQGSGAKFTRGIMFGYDSLTIEPVVGGIAMALPATYGLVWYINDNGVNHSGLPAAFIRSDMTTLGSRTGPASLIFGDNAVNIDPGNNVIAASFGLGLNSFQSCKIDGILSIQNSGSEVVHIATTGDITTAGKLSGAGQVSAGAGGVKYPGISSIGSGQNHVFGFDWDTSGSLRVFVDSIFVGRLPVTNP